MNVRGKANSSRVRNFLIVLNEFTRIFNLNKVSVCFVTSAGRSKHLSQTSDLRITGIPLEGWAIISSCAISDLQNNGANFIRVHSSSHKNSSNTFPRAKLFRGDLNTKKISTIACIKYFRDTQNVTPQP